MRYFPISIDTKNKKMAFLGGGKIAERIINNFLKSEIKIYVFSNDFTKKIKSLKNIKLIKREIDENFNFDLFDYVVISLNNKELAFKLEKKLKKEKKMYMIADERSESTFITGKVIEKNAITVSVNTDGKNPFISKLIGEKIENLLGKLSIEKINLLNEIRIELIKKNYDVSRETKKLINKDIDYLKKYLENL
ncbi:MAG: NAD(P)-dependent oxidoreductase [Peptoniphilaceae bacterium]|nr:NAD(P)-dependent oxidoreductase [Peptoniphilaceae bacterium]